MKCIVEGGSRNRSRPALVILFMLAATVSACGGGGSGSPSPAAAPGPGGAPPPSGGGGGTPAPSPIGGGGTPAPVPTPAEPKYVEIGIPAIDGLWKSGSESLQISGRSVAGQPSWSSFYDASANVSITFDINAADPPVDGQLRGSAIEYRIASDPTVWKLEFKDNSHAQDTRTQKSYVNRFVPQLTEGAWCVVGSTGKGFVFTDDGSLPDRTTDFSAGLNFTAAGTEIGTNAPVQLDFEVADPATKPNGSIVSFATGSTTYAGEFKGVSTMSLTSAAGALVLQRSKRTDCSL